MIRTILGVGVVLLCLITCDSLFAQGVGSSTSTGAFGSRNFGTGVSGSAASRNQGLTQTGQLTSSAAIQRDAGAFVGAGSGGGNVRSLNNAGGASSFGFGSNSPLGFSTIGSGLGNNFGFMNFGRGNNNQQGAGLTNAQPSAPIRTTLTLGFQPRRPSATVVSNQFRARLSNIRQIGRKADIDVSLAGRTAILRGVVASQHARDLAERLALLEPGIASVDNQLTVARPDSELPLLPPLPIPEP